MLRQVAYREICYRFFQNLISRFPRFGGRTKRRQVQFMALPQSLWVESAILLSFIGGSLRIAVLIDGCRSIAENSNQLQYMIDNLGKSLVDKPLEVGGCFGGQRGPIERWQPKAICFESRVELSACFGHSKLNRTIVSSKALSKMRAYQSPSS